MFASANQNRNDLGKRLARSGRGVAPSVARGAHQMLALRTTASEDHGMRSMSAPQQMQFASRCSSFPHKASAWLDPLA